MVDSAKEHKFCSEPRACVFTSQTATGHHTDNENSSDFSSDTSLLPSKYLEDPGFFSASRYLLHHRTTASRADTKVVNNDVNMITEENLTEFRTPSLRTITAPELALPNNQDLSKQHTPELMAHGESSSSYTAAAPTVDDAKGLGDDMIVTPQDAPELPSNTPDPVRH